MLQNVSCKRDVIVFVNKQSLIIPRNIPLFEYKKKKIWFSYLFWFRNIKSFKRNKIKFLNLFYYLYQQMDKAFVLFLYVLAFPQCLRRDLNNTNESNITSIVNAVRRNFDVALSDGISSRTGNSLKINSSRDVQTTRCRC